MHYNIKPFFIKKLYENIDIFVHDNKNHFLYKKKCMKSSDIFMHVNKKSFL